MTTLPPGQRAIPSFPRFGIPAFASRAPRDGTPIGLAIADGDTLTAADLERLPRVEITAAFHCVTTWSKLDLRWSGWRVRDVVEAHLTKRRYLELRAADGYRVSVLLEDAMGDDVLLADRLDGEPLTVEHGAPLRLVAPQLYGYKNVKHVVGITTSDVFHVSAAERQTRAHPRGRVAFEERGRALPGWTYRVLYRALLRPSLWWYARAAKRPA